jgi:hypothetical protein
MSNIWASVKQSRKLWMALLLLVAGTVIWFSGDNRIYADWVEMAKWLFGIYCGGNGIEHYTKAKPTVTG